MAKNKRGRAVGGPMPPYATSILKQLLTESPGSAFRSDSGSVWQDEQNSSDPQKRLGAERVRQWYEGCLDILDSFPDDIVDADTYEPPHAFHVSAIYSDGTVTGQYRQGSERYDVMVAVPDGSLRKQFACSCPTSLGKYYCSHCFHFVDYVYEQLRDYRSWLNRQVAQGLFHSGSMDPKRFDFSDKARIESLLDALVVPEAAMEIDDAQLPPLQTVSQDRIAWNISTRGTDHEVFAVVQQAKKRGGGWTKGRKTALTNLADLDVSLSEADRRIKALIQFESNYYRVHVKLDPVAAIREMVGQPNILFNNHPAEVVRFDATFAFCKDDEHCWLGLVGSKQYNNTYLFNDSCLIHIRNDLASVRVCDMHPSRLKTIVSVFRLPRIPVEFEQDLLRRVADLQRVINIKVPETIAGQIVADACRPVVLLRAHASGSLDYGVRVRDAMDVLHRPGTGLMLKSGNRDGQPVQFQRDADAEVRAAEELLGRLGQTARTFDGSIQDFEAALQLIAHLQDLEADGTEVLWDKGSEKPLKVLGAVTSSNVSVGINRKQDWFQLSGSCQLGEESVELVDLLGALQETGDASVRGDFVRIGDKGWTKIEKGLRAQLTGLRDSITQDRRSLKFDATSASAVRDFLSHDVQVEATRAWHQCLVRLERAEKLEPVLPSNLNATLRDYQTDGFRWLRRLAEWGVGGILADDMGLGKTLQTLAVILDRSSEGPTLVIAPTSVGFNWVREAERFAPDLSVHLYRETERGEFLNGVGPGTLVVCSYGLALRDAEALAGVQWSTLVLDEAQAIKNSRSKTSAAIATIPAQWKVALTGTPVENHLGELWSLFHVISPGVFGGWDQFRKRFAGPIEKDNNESRRLALRDRLQPFVLRRTKTEVLKDLPPRSDMNLYVELSDAERRMYDKVRASAIGEIDQIANLGDVKDQRFKILALLTRLRQIACSPRMVDESLTQRSSKLQLLLETVAELKEEGHRVLIFSQFVKHLALIREMFDQEEIRYEYLDGQTPADQRQAGVDRFQNGDATAFLISLKAGGTGLNLTAADYVIHMDPWWNPAVEDQATDRAHRIGQENPVMVYRLISEGTIEEEILKLHDAKRDLVSGVMEGTHAAAKLSTSDLIDLVRGT
ncbi:ATP-dependent helicase HepA [Rosistilla carotiformis]|uniref:ATP-dependent helicase HepA n=1 Tax=Rosistilla carotiformis TaxID=2528017 RepID=A0A518JV68_9BACT|nr:DEAD/DEAH box helicase [Rosistilla carotiformis]QDV69441.1 ATP-dependent helicase HepA [Rosistilla carotiformis]